MDVLAETLDNRLREWRPEMAAEARARISEMIELAGHGEYLRDMNGRRHVTAGRGTV